MKKGPRNLLFALVVVIFLITAPMLILFALGYRYDADEGAIRKTAIIAVKFQPQDVAIYLDNKFIDQQKKEILISGLTKNRYSVRLEKDGYQDWSQDFLVEPGKVSWAENVILFMKKLREDVLTQKENILSVVPSDDHTLLFISAQKNDEVFVTIRSRRTLNEENSIPLTKFTSVVPDATFDFAQAIWVPGGQFILIPFAEGDGGGWVSLDYQSETIRNLSPILSSTTTFHINQNDNAVVVYDDITRSIYNLITQEVVPQEEILVFEKAFSTYRVKKSDNTCTLEQTTDFINEAHVVSSVVCDEYTVSPSPQGNFVLHGQTTHSLYYLDHDAKTVREISTQADTFRLAPRPEDGDVVVFQSGNELSAYASKDDVTVLVTRTGEPISTYLPHTNGSHVFYIIGDKLNAAEITAGIHINTAQWQLDGPLPIIVYGNDENKIIFSENEERADSQNKELIEAVLYE